MKGKAMATTKILATDIKVGMLIIHKPVVFRTGELTREDFAPVESISQDRHLAGWLDAVVSTGNVRSLKKDVEYTVWL
jgi:hypothetical protein